MSYPLRARHDGHRAIAHIAIAGDEADPGVFAQPLFLIVLIGTTVETLTKDSRQTIRIQRWRKKMRNHTVVVGYDTKGRTAVSAMMGDGVPSGEIVVVDTDQASLDRANAAGLVTIRGDAVQIMEGHLVF